MCPIMRVTCHDSVPACVAVDSLLSIAAERDRRQIYSLIFLEREVTDV